MNTTSHMIPDGPSPRREYDPPKPMPLPSEPPDYVGKICFVKFGDSRYVQARCISMSATSSRYDCEWLFEFPEGMYARRSSDIFGVVPDAEIKLPPPPKPGFWDWMKGGSK